MAYCRFSTDDFLCDLYCYEDIRGGFTTHVAALKVVYAEPLPPVCPIEDFGWWWLRHQKVMQMHKTADKVPIGLPHDGETFNDDTLEEFIDRLLMLKEAGYRFPEDVIEAVREEIREGA